MVVTPRPTGYTAASFWVPWAGCRKSALPAHPVWLLAHLHRHPDLATFTQSPDCVLLEVVVEAYQVVHGIDEVSWWCVEDLK